MIPCPEFLRAMALKAGCPEDEVDEVWEAHVTLVDKDGGNYGGRRWVGLVEKHVRDGARIPTIERTDPAIEAARIAARRAKDAADAEYAKHAVSLTDYLANLRVRADFYETMTPLEAHIARFRNPEPGEDPAAWLMAAVDGYDGPIDERHKRRRKV